MKRLRSVALLLALTAIPLAWAVPTNAQQVAQSYNTDTQLQKGLIVRLESKNSKKVVPVEAEDASKAYGIVISPNDAAIALSGDGSARQAYVANDGNYKVLVTDQQGAIGVGDFIAVSSLAGVGMKANDQQKIVIGKAASAFDGVTNLAGTTKIRDSEGKDHEVHFGYVTTSVSIAKNPLLKNTVANLPGFLERATTAIADKPVSPLRAYMSCAVLLITAVIVGSVLYSGIRASMIALGRNPLAKRTIYHSLLRIVLVSLIVLCTGLGAVYLLLRL